MQPLVYLEWKWEFIAYNFISSIPKTRNQHDAIWVIVDRLTNAAHFILIRMDFVLDKLAKAIYFRDSKSK